VAIASVEGVNAPRRAALVAAAMLLAAAQAVDVGAHSGLRFSSPLDGATLGASPEFIHLTFVERPEPALSSVRVVDTNGVTYHTGRLDIASGDPLSLVVPVKPLGRGVYVVHWRVVSAVDGHATAGAFAFGVLVAPTAVGQPAAEGAESSPVEAAARTIFLLGLLIALGAAAAVVVAPPGSRTTFAAGAGVMLSAIGLVLLAVAQARVAGVAIAVLTSTSIGQALVTRAIAVAAMIAAAAIAWYGSRRASLWMQAGGLALLAVAAIAAMVAHSAAGHAAAGRWPVMSTVAFHTVHIAAASVWLGGLAALLLVMRRADLDEYARAFARFSVIAAFGLAAVAVTGIVRSVHEIDRWRDLWSTSYGNLVLVKGVLLCAIAALGASNRFRNVALAAVNPRPLQRAAGVELGLAILAAGAAGLLGTLAPPAAASPAAAIEVSGTDFGTTVRATLLVTSDQPGPNRFTVTIEDYDTGDRIDANRVRLRFTPIDDPGVSPTLLDLTTAPNGGFAGAGTNLAFSGRWRINVLVERSNNSVDVPVDVETRALPQRVSIFRPPNQPVTYTAEVGKQGFIQIEIDAERSGPTVLRVTTHNVISESLPVDQIVVTAGERSATRQLAVTRHDRNHFSAPADLSSGSNRIAVIATTESGSRLHAIFLIDASTP
jgi:copper transport protein